MYIIYSLNDPITNEVRYVGKTSLKRKHKRLYEHIKYAYKNTTYSATWIRSLLKVNKRPIMNVLEVVMIEESESREVYWISQFDNLTNLTDGGEKTFKFNPVVIERLRVLNSGENNPCFGKTWTDEQRKNLSDSLKGKLHTQEHKDKIGASLSKRISIDGIIYKSIRFAAKELHIRNSTIIERLKSIDYPLWVVL